MEDAFNIARGAMGDPVAQAGLYGESIQQMEQQGQPTGSNRGIYPGW